MGGIGFHIIYNNAVNSIIKLNLSVTTIFLIKFVPCDLFSNVF